MEKIQLAFVDDDSTQRLLISTIFAKVADVTCFSSADDFLNKIEQLTPDVIILDVDLPTITGYILCRRLKKYPTMRQVPVIFLSAHAQLNAKIKGYDAGAEDFLVKPFKIDEIIAKVNVLAKLKKQRSDATNTIDSLAKQVDLAKHDMGGILDYVKKSQSCFDYVTLGKLIFRFLCDDGLQGIMEIRADGECYDISNDDIITPLQVDLLQSTLNKGGIFIQNHLLTVNQSHISLLLTNIPVDNKVKSDRIKELAVQLCAVANNRIKSLIAISLLSLQYDDINEIVHTIDQLCEDNEIRAVKLKNKLITSIESFAVKQDLTEQQEEYLIGIINSTDDELHHFIDDLGVVSNQIKEIPVRQEKVVSLLSKGSSPV